NSGRDEQALDLQSLGSGLRRDHAIGEHELGGLAGLVGRTDELDEPGLAATAGVDLRFDDGEPAVAETGRLHGAGVGRGRVLGAFNNLTGRHGDARLSQQFTRLIFVDLQCACAPARRWWVGDGEPRARSAPPRRFPARSGRWRAAKSARRLLVSGVDEPSGAPAAVDQLTTVGGLHTGAEADGALALAAAVLVGVMHGEASEVWRSP